MLTKTGTFHNVLDTPCQKLTVLKVESDCSELLRQLTVTRRLSLLSPPTLKEADVLAYGSHFAVSRATYATMYSSSWQSGYTYDPLHMISLALERPHTI